MAKTLHVGNCGQEEMFVIAEMATQGSFNSYFSLDTCSAECKYESANFLASSIILIS
jgi:hypothetical protein